MNYKGIEYGKEELLSFQGFFPDAAGANLLNRMMIESAQKYEELLHDPNSNLEVLRFAQGALEGMGKVNLLIKEFMGLGYEDGKEAVESEMEEAESIEMGF